MFSFLHKSNIEVHDLTIRHFKVLYWYKYIRTLSYIFTKFLCDNVQIQALKDTHSMNRHQKVINTNEINLFKIIMKLIKMM